MSNQLLTTNFSIVPVGVSGRVTPLTTETVLTIPTGASGVLIQANGQDVRFAISAGTLSATQGFLIRTTEQPVRLDLFPGASIRLIETAVGGSIDYTFFKGV